MATNMAKRSEGQLLREARERVNWSQRDIAARLGISPGYIALLEAGTKRASNSLWMKVSALFAGQIETANLSFARDMAETSALDSLEDLTGVPDYSWRAEFKVESPFGEEWLSTFPFTIIAGPPGSGKTTFLLSHLQEIVRSGRWNALWVNLHGNPGPNEIHRRILEALGHPREGLFPEVSPRQVPALARDAAERVEDWGRGAKVLCLDDWSPSEPALPDFVGALRSHLRRTPLVATTTPLGREIPGAVTLPVPRPAVDSWAAWCANWHVPRASTSVLMEKLAGNPLAAQYLRGAVFFRLSEDRINRTSQEPEKRAETLWSHVIEHLPESPSNAWHGVVETCREFLGPKAWNTVTIVAKAPESVPIALLGDESRTGVVSRLIEYKFLRPRGEGYASRLTTHDVLRQYAVEPATFPHFTLSENIEPADIDALLALSSYEQAAAAIEELIGSARRQGMSLPSLGEWMNLLPAEVIRRHPLLRLGFARHLALREGAGDLERARLLLDELAADSGSSDALLWQVLQHAADIAIRQIDYERAGEMVSRAQALARSTGSAFDETPLRVLRARIAWEQGEFKVGLEATSSRNANSNIDGARLLSWRARCHASLGNFAAAVKSAQNALDLSRREHLPRAEAYNCALLSEYELLRGRFSQARSMADRARLIAKELGQTNLEAQVLETAAEILALDLKVDDAAKCLSLAQDALTLRQADPWSAPYLLVSKARVARAKGDWLDLCSLAQMMERESKEAVGRYAPRHPVVQALLVEAADCWAAVGYFHETARVLDLVRLDTAEWRTQWDYQRLRLLTEVSPEAVLTARFRELTAAAVGAGCPYLAASCGYNVASHAWRTGLSEAGGRYARWTLDVASSRGWSVLGLKAAGLATTQVPKEELARGKTIMHRDGTRSVIAPPRGQQKARKETGIPLPDPFGE